MWELKAETTTWFSKRPHFIALATLVSRIFLIASGVAVAGCAFANDEIPRGGINRPSARLLRPASCHVM